MGSCASWNRIYSSNSIHALYTEALAPHKKYGGKGIHYVGGYTQAHLTLWRECYNSRSRYISCLFIIVILQSLVSSLISIVRERERARETEKCVMLLTIKIRQPVWWHSYSKIMVCLLLWNISLNYGQDPNMHNLYSLHPRGSCSHYCQT